MRLRAELCDPGNNPRAIYLARLTVSLLKHLVNATRPREVAGAHLESSLPPTPLICRSTHTCTSLRKGRERERERERRDFRNAAERRGNHPAFRGCQDIFLAAPPCMHNACTCGGERGRAVAGSAADSLRGENSKSFVVTIFLIASPPPDTLPPYRSRTVARAVPVNPSRKDVGINKMIWWLHRRCTADKISEIFRQSRRALVKDARVIVND